MGHLAFGSSAFWPSLHSSGDYRQLSRAIRPSLAIGNIQVVWRISFRQGRSDGSSFWVFAHDPKAHRQRSESRQFQIDRARGTSRDTFGVHPAGMFAGNTKWNHSVDKPHPHEESRLAYEGRGIRLSTEKRCRLDRERRMNLRLSEKLLHQQENASQVPNPPG